MPAPAGRMHAKKGGRIERHDNDDQQEEQPVEQEAGHDEEYYTGMHSQQQEGYAAGYAAPEDDAVYSQEGYNPGTNPHAPAYVSTGATVYHGYSEATEEDYEQQAFNRGDLDVRRAYRRPPAATTN